MTGLQEETRKHGAIAAISSHVVRGGVGNRSMVPALEATGFSVWSVPTITLPYHPGHGPATRIVPDPEQFSSLLSDLANSSWTGELAGLVSGYMANEDQAIRVAKFVTQLKQRHPGLVYLCDPVIGDHNGLYVKQQTAEAIRDHLLPLADIATPNLHELAWLGAQPAAETAPQAALQARQLGPGRVVVTSAPAFMRGNTGNLLVEKGQAVLAEHRLVDGPSNGAGDLFSGLFLAHVLCGTKGEKALSATTSSVFEIMARSARAGAGEVILAGEWASLMRPSAMVTLRRVTIPLLPENGAGAG
ncbi:MAG: pyridoxal kinase [Nitratireductor sp.]